MWRLRGGWQCWSAHQGGRAPSALTWEPATESYICSFSRIISGKKSFPILALKPLGGWCAPQVKWVFSEWCSECVKKWRCKLQIQLCMEACIHLQRAFCPVPIFIVTFFSNFNCIVCSMLCLFDCLLCELCALLALIPFALARGDLKKLLLYLHHI